MEMDYDSLDTYITNMEMDYAGKEFYPVAMTGTQTTEFLLPSNYSDLILTL